MRECPYCGEEIQEDAKVCPRCRTALTAPPTAGGMSPQPATSGKAVASLVLGIFPFIPLVGSVVAIVLGYVSRDEIRRSAGRLKGEGLALAGLILGCVHITVVPFIILIVAAIAIPNLLRARIAANQAAAVGSLRAINSAEVIYATTYGGYSPTLAALGPPPSGQPTAESANMIDSVLSGGTKLGYVFAYQAGEPDATGRITTYTLHADPLTEGTTGTGHYFTDQTGVIRQERDRQADSASPSVAFIPQGDEQRDDFRVRHSAREQVLHDATRFGAGQVGVMLEFLDGFLNLHESGAQRSVFSNR